MKTARYRDTRPTVQAPHKCECGYPITDMSTYCVGCTLTRPAAVLPKSIPVTPALLDSIVAEFMASLEVVEDIDIVECA